MQIGTRQKRINPRDTVKSSYYNTYAWRKLVDFVWDRDKGLCQICLRQDKRHYLKRYTKDIKLQGTVDHKIPRKRGGSDHPDNLELIGSNHHAVKSAKERLKK